jgi:hypothetical protein
MTANAALPPLSPDGRQQTDCGHPHSTDCIYCYFITFDPVGPWVLHLVSERANIYFSGCHEIMGQNEK